MNLCFSITVLFLTSLLLVIACLTVFSYCVLCLFCFLFVCFFLVYFLPHLPSRQFLQPFILSPSRMQNCFWCPPPPGLFLLTFVCFHSNFGKLVCSTRMKQNVHLVAAPTKWKRHHSHERCWVDELVDFMCRKGNFLSNSTGDVVGFRAFLQMPNKNVTPHELMVCLEENFLNFFSLPAWGPRPLLICFNVAPQKWRVSLAFHSA